MSPTASGKDTQMATISFVQVDPAHVEVTAEVAKEIEEAYAEMKKNPNLKAMADFTDTRERDSWLRQARSYVRSRKNGVLSFRILPDKAKALKPETQFYFRLSADLPGNAQRNANGNQQ